MISARHQDSRPTSPNKTTSATASETVLAEPQALRRQNSATLSSGAVPRSSRSASPSKRSAASVLERYRSLVGMTEGEDEGAASEPCGLDFLLQACDMLEPTHGQGNNG